MKLTIPNQGLVFWPVGTGDSTTIRITETHFMQVDLHHMEQAEDGSDSARPVVDELLEILPTRRGHPYLSAFVLTHPDEDHCKGFARLNEKALISELWICADSFRGPNANLCDDAKAFRQEAIRRINKTIEAGGDPGPGHRIRVIGSDPRG